MRVSAAVCALFDRVDFIRKANFLGKMHGGWERWLQLEIACYLNDEYARNYDIFLETSEPYDDPALRADLLLTAKYGSRTSTAVELKCQIAGSRIEQFVQLVEKDIQKGGHIEPGEDYQVIAIVWDKRDIDKAFHALALVHPGELSRYYFPDNLSGPAGFISVYRAAQ